MFALVEPSQYRLVREVRLCRLEEAVRRKQNNHSVRGALHYLAYCLPDVLVKLHALPVLEFGVDTGA